MQLVLEISLILLRVTVFVALLQFLFKYSKLTDNGDEVVHRVRSAMINLVTSNMIIYGILIYSLLRTFFGPTTQNIQDIVMIFIVNLIAGFLTLHALYIIRSIQEGK